MLSEESTLGEHPIAAVEMMTKVALKVEDSEHHAERLWGDNVHHDGVGEAISTAAMEAAEKVGAKYIVTH